MATSATAGRDGRQQRWAKHNEERRQQILDAALAVVEENEPGAEFHVQQIAERAGLNRTVVYRHFADRADLDRAIQTDILDDLIDLLLPAVALDGTINEIITRIVSTYVEWTVAHPALHRFAESQSGATLEMGMSKIAASLVEVLEAAVEMLGVTLGDDEQAAIDPLAHGLVGAVLGAVRRWATRDPRQPSSARMGELISESVWYLVDGHARRLGLELDPDVPVEELLQGADPEVVSS